MTKGRMHVAICSRCGQKVDMERPWQRWVRNNPRLDSIQRGLSIQDIDMWIHQYKTFVDRVGTREVNNLMLVEVKEGGGLLDYAQRDTLLITDQLLRTGNQYKSVRDASGNLRKIRCWGVHTMRFAMESPEGSDLIEWDGKSIDLAMLEELLIFQRDPDTLQERSERRHHTRSQLQRAFWR